MDDGTARVNGHEKDFDLKSLLLLKNGTLIIDLQHPGEHQTDADFLAADMFNFVKFPGSWNHIGSSEIPALASLVRSQSDGTAIHQNCLSGGGIGIRCQKHGSVSNVFGDYGAPEASFSF